MQRLSVWAPIPFRTDCAPVSITGPQAVSADPGVSLQFYASLGQVGGHILFQPHPRFGGALSSLEVITMPV